MSTFYLLPPRPFLGACFAGYLQAVFPGLEWASNRWSDLADTLETATHDHPSVYVVYREELPEDEDVDHALMEGFGAEAGDEVVEVRAGTLPGQFMAHRRRLGEMLQRVSQEPEA